MKFTDKNNKPKAIAPQLDNLPAELKAAKQFVLWSYTWSVRSGSWAKVPFAVTGKPASTTDPATWSTFDECNALLMADSRYDGVGFVFSKDCPFVGIDIDNCITDGKLSIVADEIVNGCKSYTELSPSRSGVHIIGRGQEVPAAKGTWRGAEVEVYAEGRYFTLTGQVQGYSEVNDVGKRASELAMLIKDEAAAKSAIASSDRQLSRALKDPYIKALFTGDLSEYDNDHSRADLALCSKLAAYAGNNHEALDRMFRKSKLFRDKWDERHGSDTYGNITIAKALEGSNGSHIAAAPLSLGRATPGSSKETRTPRRFTVDEMWDKVMEFRESGGARGFHPGWDGLEKFYRPTLGSLTALLGVPSSGKSTWIDCLVYNMAKRHGWKTTLASFESLPIERHINSLCQIHLQKPTYTFVPGHATEREMNEARKALNDWFYFIMPDDDEMTVDSILDYVQDDIDDHGIKGFVLDPFTEVDLPRSNGTAEVETIKNELKKIQQFTRSKEIHTWLLVHPTKSGDTNYKQEEKGMRPTLYAANGAAHFRNKADFGLVIHRWDDDTVNLYVDKVRNAETNGGVGKVEYKYVAERREYEEVKPDAW